MRWQTKIKKSGIQKSLDSSLFMPVASRIKWCSCYFCVIQFNNASFLRSIWQVQFARTAHHAIAFSPQKCSWEKSSYHPASWHLEEQQWSWGLHTRIWSPCCDLNRLIWSNCYLADIQVVTIWMGHHFKDFSTTSFGSRSLTKRSLKNLLFPILGSNEPLAHLSKDLALPSTAKIVESSKIFQATVSWLSSR